MLRDGIWGFFGHVMSTHDPLPQDDLRGPFGPRLRRIAVNALHVVSCRPEQGYRHSPGASKDSADNGTGLIHRQMRANGQA